VQRHVTYKCHFVLRLSTYVHEYHFRLLCSVTLNNSHLTINSKCNITDVCYILTPHTINSKCNITDVCYILTPHTINSNCNITDVCYILTPHTINSNCNITDVCYILTPQDQFKLQHYRCMLHTHPQGQFKLQHYRCMRVRWVAARSLKCTARAAPWRRRNKATDSGQVTVALMCR
jgi:acetyltransferase-like isoleucine patch superfamily enzyme